MYLLFPGLNGRSDAYVLLSHVVGFANTQVKKITTTLPPEEFAYGLSRPRDSEGAREGSPPDHIYAIDACWKFDD